MTNSDPLPPEKARPPQVNTIGPIRLIVDIILHVSVGMLIIILRYCVEPYHRGFYCDDDSIRYQYKNDIVSNTALMVGATMIPIFSIVCVEIFRLRKIESKLRAITVADDRTITIEIPREFVSTAKSTYIGNRLIHPLLYRLVCHCFIFYFGFMVCVVVTFVGKLTMGNLRPHFIDVCKPIWNNTDCSSHSIFDGEIVCSGNLAAIKEARQSFPSGHASISTYAAFFLIFYLRSRTSGFDSPNMARLIAPVVQCVLVSCAFFVGLTRVADNHHHLTDVAFGWALGAATAAMICLNFKLIGRKEREWN